MDSLRSVKDSTLSSDAPKMIDVLKRLPEGWYMVETGNGFVIRDADDEFVCEAESAERLNEILSNEFELAQLYASMMFILKSTNVAEA